MTPTKIFTFISFISSVVLIFILNFYTPAETGAFGILIVFLLLYIIFTSLLSIAIQKVRIAIRRSKNLKLDEDLLYRHSYYYAAVLSVAPLFLLSLGSVGRLNPTSYALVFVLVGILSLYISRQVR